MKKIILSVLALLLFCLAGCKDQTGTVPRRKAPPREMVLAAGQTVGGYGSLGGDLVNLVNQDGKQPPLKATDSTGSLANLELLRQEKADLALVQSDAAWYARTGTGPYEGRPIEDLEQVGTLMPETVQIITYDLTGIRKLQDLKGKTVSVGAPGSGSALNARQLLEAAGIAEDDVRIPASSGPEGSGPAAPSGAGPCGRAGPGRPGGCLSPVPAGDHSHGDLSQPDPPLCQCGSPVPSGDPAEGGPGTSTELPGPYMAPLAGTEGRPSRPASGSEKTVFPGSAAAVGPRCRTIPERQPIRFLSLTPKVYLQNGHQTCIMLNKRLVL